MKHMKTTILSAALTGCMLLAGTAQAANYGTVNATLNSISPGLTNGIGGGQFNFQNTNTGTFTTPLMNGPSGAFIAFCLDTVDFISVGANHTYTVQDVADAPQAAGAMGATKANDVAKLVGAVLGGSFANASAALNTNLLASAFQLALWEIVNETSGTYDSSSGTFSRGDATVQAQANTYLGLLANATAAPRLYSLTKVGVQDFLVQTVPIPAAAWLLGSGLLGLFGLARRKTAVATA